MGNVSNAIFCDTCQKTHTVCCHLFTETQTHGDTYDHAYVVYIMSKIEAEMHWAPSRIIPSSVCVCVCVCVCVWATKACLTLCDPMNCSLPTSSVHGILQVRILEWVAVSCSGGSSQSRDRTQVSCIAGRFLTIWATREAPKQHKAFQIPPNLFPLIFERCCV